jgi:CheY-like chemotaxis protein
MIEKQQNPPLGRPDVARIDPLPVKTRNSQFAFPQHLGPGFQPLEPFSMNVLIVEDSLTTSMTLEVFVSACGHCPFCVFDGWLDFPSASQWNIDFVLLDILLPRANGYDLAAQMREHGLRVPIIAVTSLEDDPGKREACGIDGYLAKPVSMEGLKAVFQEFQMAGRA